MASHAEALLVRQAHWGQQRSQIKGAPATQHGQLSAAPHRRSGRSGLTELQDQARALAHHGCLRQLLQQPHHSNVSLALPSMPDSVLHPEQQGSR